MLKKMTKLILLAASLLALVIVSPSFAANTMTAADKAQIETIIRDYIIKNPEVLLEAMQVLQRKQYEQAQQTVKQTQKIASSFAKPLFHQDNDPISGDPKGTVTVVEFFDYQCPHCVDMVPVMSAIINANPNLRVVYKEFPIRGPISEFAAKAALAANRQGKYAVFSHALLTTTAPLTQDSILQIAKTSGLNVEQLQKDMQDAAIQNQLKANSKLAQDLKLFGTPALFVGKTDAQGSQPINYIPGQTNVNELQAIINKVS